jgi:hypothetical protein
MRRRTPCPPEGSIALARRNLAGSGVEDRVRFEVCDLTEPADQPYDVITMFEALHDLSHPCRSSPRPADPWYPAGCC